MDKIVSNINLYTILFSISYFLISIFVIYLSSRIIASKYSDYFEQIQHGNVSASIIFSSILISLALNLGFCITHKHIPLLFILISIVSTLILLFIYLLLFDKFKEVIEEAINNNNIGVGLMLSSAIIVIALILGFSLP